MMAIQNFGFYLMYYQIYLTIPVMDDCSNTRFWVGFFALDCFVESFCVLWMAMGGYIDSTCMFAFGWILHLLVALPYCICSVGIPVVVYSAEGALCRTAMGPTGLALVPVVWTHVALFGVYVCPCEYRTRDTYGHPRRSSRLVDRFIAARQVWMMLSITWYSFAKPTFFKGKYGKATVSVA